MQERVVREVKELPEITVKTDTRDILAHATMQAEAFEDYFLVDIDAHVTETQFWPEIIERIDNDVIRQMGQAMQSRPGVSTALLNAQPGMLYQNVYGRIPHQVALAEAVDGSECHHRAGAPFDGCDGPRLPGGVSHPDAGARHAPAGRHRGRRRACLQPLAG
jgi:hypothetical protein